MSNFSLNFEVLPVTLPIFPLPNAVVMPGCQLPLNIFEPRYLNMVFDALTENRMIGMVQPEPERGDSKTESIYRTGTAGRITFFNETSDGRLMIVLTGVCRFDITEEIPTSRGYLRAQVDWSRFRCDYDSMQAPDADKERKQLLRRLRDYFAMKQLETDWTILERMETIDLINRLTCALPLDLAERQLLVEAVSTQDRIASLMALLRYETIETAPVPSRRH